MSKPNYDPVNPQVAWPEMERKVLERWAHDDVFRRSISERSGAPEWVFYEGPPTANGKPGIHHVEARSFKDLFCRFQTMRGHVVHRKGGWDCHGLPVEIEVEKQLGITQKRQIEEEIGIEEFTRRCRESVTRYVDDWARLTDRIGFWVDMDDPYWTMSKDYVESVWWILKQIWDKGLLEEDFKVVPYCPRCETALSSHEQHYAGSYRTVSDPSVYVRFPLVEDPSTALLVWTTTPWTLLANMAAAVGPDITYATVTDPADPYKRLIVARDLVERLFGEGAEVLDTTTGADLVDRPYSPPFSFVPRQGLAHTVRPGDFVSTEGGSGIVHMAPYGEDDINVAKRDDLPIVQIITASGRVDEKAGEFAHLWFKDADEKIVEDLDRRRVLFKSEVYEHSYPHCWRCGTPLIYYARKDWYIRTSQLRAQLQASNEDTNWYPETIKYGRFGDWLANNVDWSLSRDRYWGTPLPVWRCDEGHATCVGSIAELAELAGRDLDDLDPHRPHVDEVTISCPECGSEARRVKSVIDAWFDSGSMPFAQWHYPFENEEVFDKRFPAHFISEGIDQTRGWFYSLLAISTLVRGENSFRNCVVLGLLLDAEGRKMSKSVGNVLEPWSVIDVQGADAVRWYLLTGGTPWSARRVSTDIIQEVLRKYLLTLWNTYSFWVTYASLEGFDPAAEDIPTGQRSEMDRWVLAELDDTIREVTEAMEAFDAARGGRRLDRFVDDLSNWYVRRSRRRFWRSSEDGDTRAAFLTLWECLVAVAKMTAPFTPFVADEIFSNITRVVSDEPDSVHLADWPQRRDGDADDALRRRMGAVRKLVALGRAARTEAKVRVRQPLSRALLVVPAAEASDVAQLEDLVAEELNVKTLEVSKGLDQLVSYTIKPNFKALGPRFGPRVKEVAGALAAADARELVASLEANDSAEISVDGEEISLSRDDLDVRVEGREGFSLAQDGPYGVALDLDLTPDLEAEGVAREIVRAVQDLRKSSGLAVEDRITLWLDGSEDITEALRRHSSYIGTEVLAPEVHIGRRAPQDAPAVDVDLDGGTASIGLARA
ncbi:MAG: isoleucine--tRNA ligase [Actinomycetota bacterium]|nr:isoleucine--tRNA ligase [Actinomycetota bacterium]